MSEKKFCENEFIQKKKKNYQGKKIFVGKYWGGGDFLWETISLKKKISGKNC